jgi:ribose transport system substrate-binding protein
VTQENLAQYVQPDMPPLHYAMCGCEEMPGFPERWQ